MKWGKVFEFQARVEFEDVDVLKAVHHPNYLNFCERARGQALIESGYPFLEMLNNGFGFVIADVRMIYKKPLQMGMEFSVVSQLAAVSSASFRVTQVIAARDAVNSARFAEEDVEDWEKCFDLCFRAELVLVHIESQTGKPVPFHQRLLDTMGIQALSRSEKKSNEVRMA